MATENALTADALFQPFQLGDITLANRMVMAPLTRNRAEAGNVPGPLTVEYYAQRASVGLIVAEATQVSAQAQGYVSTPGLHTPEQIAGWKKVTDAVHAKGGKIFVQLWHTGRMSHRAFQPGEQAPVAPSAIRANAKTYIPGQGYVDTSEPRALETSEIPGIVNDFRTAARNAIEAGFDGVEIHGAHGYLLDAFLRDGSNKRTDIYGVGLLLYVMLTGRGPFDDERGMAGFARAAAYDPPPPPSSIAPVPPALEAIVLRCLEKEKEARYASADALIAALTPFLLPAPHVPQPAPLRSEPHATPRPQRQLATELLPDPRAAGPKVEARVERVPSPRAFDEIARPASATKAQRTLAFWGALVSTVLVVLVIFAVTVHLLGVPLPWGKL